MTERISEQGTLLQEAYTFTCGSAVSPQQTGEALAELQPTHKIIGNTLEIMGIAQKQGYAGEAETALKVFSDFVESSALRGRRSTALLFEASPRKWASSKGEGFANVADALYRFAGAHQEWHTIRNDGQDPNGLLLGVRVTAGQWGDYHGDLRNNFYFLESTKPSGIAKNTVRRLEIIAADHPGMVSFANQYAYPEYQLANEVLKGEGATEEERSAVLAVANRQVTPTHKKLLELLGRVREPEPRKTGILPWLGRLVFGTGSRAAQAAESSAH